MSAYVEPQTRNITRLFRTATPAEIEAGAEWYADARRIVDALAVKYGVNPQRVAGIIAALSPLNSWGNNVNLAARFLAAKDQGGLTSGYLKANLAKARAILAGENIVATLSGEKIVATLSGEKIVNFYRSILSAGEQGVTIDRHAYSLAVNMRFSDDDLPRFAGKRYAAIAECYRRAAHILSREYGVTITPAQVQSVTWVLWRRKFWAVGAFDGHSLDMGETE